MSDQEWWEDIDVKSKEKEVEAEIELYYAKQRKYDNELYEEEREKINETIPITIPPAVIKKSCNKRKDGLGLAIHLPTILECIVYNSVIPITRLPKNSKLLGLWRAKTKGPGGYVDFSVKENWLFFCEDSNVYAVVDLDFYDKLNSHVKELSNSLVPKVTPRYWMLATTGSGIGRYVYGAYEYGVVQGGPRGLSELSHVVWNLAHPEAPVVSADKLALKSYRLAEYKGYYIIDLRISNIKR